MPTPSTPALSEAKAALLRAREQGEPRALAEALVRCAELEPALRFRAAVPRNLLLEAARLLAPLPEPGLEGRCLLRLAEVQLIDGELDQVGPLCERARARLRAAGLLEEAFCTGCLEARLLLRRGEREAAERRLAEVAASVSELPGAKGGRARGRTAVALGLAIGEHAMEAQDPDGLAALRQLLAELDRQAVEAPDARFAAHQGLALLSQLGGKLDIAVGHLREAALLVRAYDSPLDLLEARLALGAGLSAAGHLPEARKVLQVVVDEARDLGQPELQLLGLTGLASVLSSQGAIQGGVDTAVQSAVLAGNRGNLPAYVRGVTLAAHILLSHQREVAAIELLMVGAAALRHTVGEQAAQLVDAQLDAIHAEMGDARFERLCAELRAVRAARKRLSE
ncbi:MAG: hypothetical protein U1A78_04025 [Polyangia bacterium]